MPIVVEQIVYRTETTDTTPPPAEPPIVCDLAVGFASTGVPGCMPAGRAFAIFEVSNAVAAYIENFFAAAPALAQVSSVTCEHIQPLVVAFRGAYEQYQQHYLDLWIDRYQSDLLRRDLDRQQEMEDGYVTD